MHLSMPYITSYRSPETSACQISSAPAARIKIDCSCPAGRKKFRMRPENGNERVLCGPSALNFNRICFLPSNFNFLIMMLHLYRHLLRISVALKKISCKIMLSSRWETWLPQVGIDRSRGTKDGISYASSEFIMCI